MDPANPNLRRFPKFKAAVGIEAVLEPGDILWFPGEQFIRTASLQGSRCVRKHVTVDSPILPYSKVH